MVAFQVTNRLYAPSATKLLRQFVGIVPLKRQVRLWSERRLKLMGHNCWLVGSHRGGKAGLRFPEWTRSRVYIDTPNPA